MSGKQIFIFRYRVASRLNRLCVYAGSLAEAEAKATARLNADYGFGRYTIFPQYTAAYDDPRQADSTMPSGLLSALSRADLEAFLRDHSPPIQKKQDRIQRSKFDRECDAAYQSLRARQRRQAREVNTSAIG